MGRPKDNRRARITRLLHKSQDFDREKQWQLVFRAIHKARTDVECVDSDEGRRYEHIRKAPNDGRSYLRWTLGTRPCSSSIANLVEVRPAVDLCSLSVIAAAVCMTTDIWIRFRFGASRSVLALRHPSEKGKESASFLEDVKSHDRKPRAHPAGAIYLSTRSFSHCYPSSSSVPCPFISTMANHLSEHTSQIMLLSYCF